jgi:hypothetical protein
MLTHYLKTSIKDIEDLIDFTIKDIDDIKQAKHTSIFERTKIKNDLVQAFENKKSLLDNELLKLVNENKDKELEEVLNPEQKEMLETIKSKLLLLKTKNKEYARYLVSISEFYNSLLDNVFPRDMDGYKKTHQKPASLLRIRA